ncbi:expressed unknown protein [Seminavis robusta]|uniref:Uncharacterized protein n=1 Tax=Seminavis robusta TaxID=568900 RepID=A0A9N8EK43_9STRA|nr:expressed unknown protein [Seminavis robusta]|eukprot:Sro1116_g242880.1 n/a (260) ;mRNA; r:17683-18577
MTAAAKQRRSKNEKGAPTETTNSAEEQLELAKGKVLQSLATVAELHGKWKLHLLRMSYMVILITIHQWQGPMTYCLYDVKSYNKSLTPLDNDNLRISGYRAMYYVLNDTLCEFLGFVMGILCTLFLNQLYNEATVVVVNGRQQPTDSFFTNYYYMFSTGLVPPVLNFYFHRSKANATKSCIDAVAGADGLWTRHAQEDEVMAKAVRGFPVVIIFHTICTVCLWFMAFQASQQSNNLLLLEKLKRELAEARKENESKKKS